MAFNLQHELFRQTRRRDEQAARDEIVGALRAANSIGTRAAKALGWEPWFLYKQMRELGIEAGKEHRLWPTRHQILCALLYYRGSRVEAANHLDVDRNWLARAMHDYGLDREVPASNDPFWRIYD